MIYCVTHKEFTILYENLHAPGIIKLISLVTQHKSAYRIFIQFFFNLNSFEKNGQENFLRHDPSNKNTESQLSRSEASSDILILSETQHSYCIYLCPYIYQWPDP